MLSLPVETKISTNHSRSKITNIMSAFLPLGLRVATKFEVTSLSIAHTGTVDVDFLGPRGWTPRILVIKQTSDYCSWGNESNHCTQW